MFVLGIALVFKTEVSSYNYTFKFEVSLYCGSLAINVASCDRILQIIKYTFKSEVSSYNYTFKTEVSSYNYTFKTEVSSYNYTFKSEVSSYNYTFKTEVSSYNYTFKSEVSLYCGSLAINVASCDRILQIIIYLKVSCIALILGLRNARAGNLRIAHAKHTLQSAIRKSMLCT